MTSLRNPLRRRLRLVRQAYQILGLMSEPEAWEPIVYPVVRQRASIFRQIVKRAEGGDTRLTPVLRLSHGRVAICDAYESSARTGCCCAGKARSLSCRPIVAIAGWSQTGARPRGDRSARARPRITSGAGSRASGWANWEPARPAGDLRIRTAATDLKCRG